MVCEGELRQVQWRGRFDLSEDDYLKIIADKTAALTACCCRLGSHYAGAARDLVERLAQFGQLLGIAFQIADDLLDLVGDEATAGKSLGTDLVKQKATLPLIRLLGQLQQGQQRQEVLAILARDDNHRNEALWPWFQRSDAIAYARDQAMEYARRAVDSWKSCRPRPIGNRCGADRVLGRSARLKSVGERESGERGDQRAMPLGSSPSLPFSLSPPSHYRGRRASASIGFNSSTKSRRSLNCR